MCKSHWIAVLLLYNVLTWKIKSEKILQSSWPAKFRAKNRMGICSFCRNFLVRLGSWRSWEEKPEECEVVTHFHLWHYFWVLVSAFVLCFKFSLLLVSVKRPCRKSKQVLYPLFAEWFQSQHMSKYHLARLASSARFRYNTLSLTCKSLLLLFLAIFVVVVAIIFPLLYFLFFPDLLLRRWQITCVHSSSTMWKSFAHGRLQGFCQVHPVTQWDPPFPKCCFD